MFARLVVVVWTVSGVAFGQTNIALNKPAFLSSGYKPEVYAGRANDGDLDTFCCSQHCVESNREERPYWGVDLQGSFKVTHVYLLPRGDPFCSTEPCSKRLGSLEIRVGFSRFDLTANRLCTYVGTPVLTGTSRNVSCDQPTCGRYLTIQRIGPPANEPLSVCEVEVYASALPIENKSLRSKRGQVGKYLDKSQHVTQPVTSTVDCLRLCADFQKDCRSVNVYVTNGILMCDVNNRTANSGGNWTSVAGSTYYELDESVCF